MADKKGTKLTENLRNGITGAFAKKEDDFNGKDLQTASILHLALGSVLGGFIGRRRAEAGKPAIGKILF